MQSKLVVVLLVAAVGSAAAVMVNAPADTNVSTKLAAKGPVASKVTAEEVAKLHHKMETIAVALEGMLKPNSPKSLAKMKVAPAFRLFVSELKATLAATAAPKDLQFALTKLKSAQAGMADLTKALNAQQESLMHDDIVEETNLLLGVLMVRRKEPMAKQMEVLNDPDFSKLPVSKAMLAKHDEKTPLVQQVALYMDAHSAAVAGSSSKADERAQKLAKTAAFFGQRVTKMEHEEEVMERAYKRQAAKIDALIKKSGNATSRRMQMSKKHLDREYKKKFAVHHQQLQVMKDVVAAVHRGDAAALKRAQAALQAHLQAMKAHTGSFLYLLQLGHRLTQQDCPFCVAQCIGKCHDGGSPYAQCMTQCATAGQ